MIERERERDDAKRTPLHPGSRREAGAIGWVLLWLIGIPIPILLVFFLLRGCT